MIELDEISVRIVEEGRPVTDAEGIGLLIRRNIDRLHHDPTPSADRAVVDSVQIIDIDMKQLAAQIGFAPQDPTLMRGTVKENIARFRNHIDGDTTAIDEAVMRVSHLFADDPLVQDMDAEDGPRFCSWYDLEADYKKFIEVVLELAEEFLERVRRQIK